MLGRDRDALREAAKVMAEAVKAQAAKVSDETAKAVNIRETADGFEVRAGYPTGRWGWEPIEGWMFETGAAHPLFGNRNHWYNQPHRPFMAIAERDAASDAMEVYADRDLDRLLKQYGYQ